MQVIWNDNLKIGIKHIDEQHEAIFGLLNILYDAIEVNKAHTILADVIKELIAYTLEHFTAEYSYMTIKAFPGRGEHNYAHEEFSRKIRDFAVRHLEGDTFFALELANFMHDWLAVHITTVDIKLRDL